MELPANPLSQQAGKCLVIPEGEEYGSSLREFHVKTHQLAINLIIYSERSLTFSTVEALDQTLENMSMTMLEIPHAALFLAGKAFIRYRRQ